MPEDHAVLQDEAAVVAPDVYCAFPGGTADVARHHAAEEPLGVFTGIPYW